MKSHLKTSVFLVAGLLFFTFCTHKPPQKLNVLMLVVDDLRPELGCFGNNVVKSPNIDMLASEGVVFSHAFCNIPVCGSSRASLLSGTRPTRFRFLTYDARADVQVPKAIVLPQHFKNNGYYTVSNGKIFHVFEDNAQSWDENWRLQTEDSWHDYALDENKRLEAIMSGPAFENADVADTVYNDGKLMLKTIADLKRLKASGQPFFLASGFVKPHLPFNAPKKYWDLYNRSGFVPTQKEFWPSNAPKQAFHNFGELRQYHGIPKSGPLSDSLSITLQHGYHACVSYTDAMIGKILNELDELGLRENTIVLLWGDHGWNLGDHGLWCKHCNFNTSLSAPLIISAPGKTKGETSAALTEFIDVYPTLCQLCGLEIPPTTEGRSLVPVLSDPKTSHKDFVILKFKDGLTIRTQHYAYTEWSKDDDILISRMLYDHAIDPNETNNIVNLPANQALVDSLRTLLHENRGADYFKNTALETPHDN